MLAAGLTCNVAPAKKIVGFGVAPTAAKSLFKVNAQPVNGIQQGGMRQEAEDLKSVAVEWLGATIRNHDQILQQVLWMRLDRAILHLMHM